MSDIEFEQLRRGQVVRLHCRGGYRIEGPVAGGGETSQYVAIGGLGCKEQHRSTIERIELLSDPAPQWKVGQVAEVTYVGPNSAGFDFCCRRLTAGWRASDGSVIADEFVTKVVPKRLVPADAVVLPAEDPATDRSWDPVLLRSAARTGLLPRGVVKRYEAIADAVEQRDAQ